MLVDGYQPNHAPGGMKGRGAVAVAGSPLSVATTSVGYVAQRDPLRGRLKGDLEKRTGNRATREHASAPRAFGAFVSVNASQSPESAQRAFHVVAVVARALS